MKSSSYYYYCSRSSYYTFSLTKITLLILAFLSFTTFGHRHQDGEPCSDDFADTAKENNITTHCKKLRSLGAEFAWSYQVNFTVKSSNTTSASITRLDILFRAKLNTNTPSGGGWVGWGVNPGNKSQMAGTIAIIAIKKKDGTMTMNTYNVTLKTKSGFALNPSRDIGMIVSKNSTWSTSQGPNNNGLYIYISATLLLPSDKYNITKLNHVWQVGESGMDNNEDQIFRHRSSLENVDSCETIDLTSDSGRSYGHLPIYLRKVHGVLNIIGWGTLLPSGIIIARYFKVFPFETEPVWFWLHIGCQVSGFIIGTVGWAIGLSLVGNASNYSFLATHRSYGLFIFTFTTLQVMAFQFRPEANDYYLKYWNLFHHLQGYGLIIIIIINIFKGISILQGGPAWKWTYIGILSLLSFITLLFEIITWVRFIIGHNNPIKLSQKSEKNISKEDKLVH